jgi:hypothetical protein
MSFLANGTIKAPTLYTIDTDNSKAYKAAVDTLINERDTLQVAYDNAKERAGTIPNELHKRKEELSRTLDKKTREDIKASIVTLEEERTEVVETMDINIKEIMRDKFAEAGVYALQNKAKAEHDGWFAEINEYEQALRSAYHVSIRELASIRGANIYKVTDTNLSNLERYIEGK